MFALPNQFEMQRKGLGVFHEEVKREQTGQTSENKAASVSGQVEKVLSCENKRLSGVLTAEK